MTSTFGPRCCTGGITGYGNKESKVVFVGIEPAYNEMRSLKPLVGNSGTLLDRTLEGVHWSRDRVYCTNICCTWFNPPSQEQILTCRPRLLAELQEIKPVFIIALGKLACEQLFDVKIGKARGAILHNVLGMQGCYGMATWHPSAILQSNDQPEAQNHLAAEFVRDLKKIALYYREGPPARLAVSAPVGSLPLIVSDVSQAQAILDSLPRDQLVILDIETPMIDKDDKESDPFEHILCVGIGLKGDVQYVFPEEILDKLTFPQDVQWGGWNLYGFDRVALLARYNIDIPVVHDGMLSSYVRDERTKYGTHKLKNNSREFAGAGFWEEDDTRKDFQSLAKYNGLDVAYNHRVLTYHLRNFDADDKRLYYDLLIPAANMLSQAQYDGVTIDRLRLHDLLVKTGNEIITLEKTIVQMASDLGFHGTINPQSDMQKRKLLFEILKIDPESVSHRTDTGLWSVDKNVLDAIDHPWAAMLRRYNHLTDTFTRYITNPLNQIKFDGKVHPKCWIPGTSTGRLSYSDPPVQQLPHARTVGELSEVRAIFTVDSPDYTLVELDYQQIELWEMQAFSGDANLLADLKEPWEVTGKPDYHSRTCVHGIPCLEHKDHKQPTCPICVRWSFDRDNQKHVNFGIPYGETAHGLMRPPPIGTGLSYNECQSLINKWYKRNPDVLQWQRTIEHLIRTMGVIKTPFGRKRRFPIVLNARQIRQGINSPVQSVAGDYTLSAAIELWRYLKQYKSRLLWITHDSMLLHVFNQYLDQVVNMAIEVMEKPRLPGFPSVKVDVAKGKNLYDVSP